MTPGQAGPGTRVCPSNPHGLPAPGTCLQVGRTERARPGAHVTAHIPASAWQARSRGLWKGPLAAPGRGVRPPECQGPSTLARNRPAGGGRRDMAARQPWRSLHVMVCIRQPPLPWGNRLSSEEPGDVGEPSSPAQRDGVGPRLARGQQADYLRVPWARTSLGGARGCVWMAAPHYSHPGRGHLVSAWQMSEWGSEGS